MEKELEKLKLILMKLDKWETLLPQMQTEGGRLRIVMEVLLAHY